MPKPESDTDSLLVGSFVSEFPDGFFGDPARTLDTNLRLDFTNVTTGKDFSVQTARGGYFYFLSNGSDQYELKGYSFRETTETAMFSGGWGVSYKFTAQPKCVDYLGHFVFTSSQPEMKLAGDRKTTWSYQYAIDRQNKVDDARAYLTKAAAGSPWLSYEMKFDFSE